VPISTVDGPFQLSAPQALMGTDLEESTRET